MTFWHPEDKKWLKQRKQAWRPIKKVLQQSESVDREFIKPLEEYFLTGKEPVFGKYDYPFLFMHFKLWFHPDQSEENWQRIIAQTSEKSFQHSMGIFFNDAGSVMDFASDYGYMGGLEERVYKIFRPETAPSPDKDMSLEVNSWSRNIWKWLFYAGANPYFTGQYKVEYIFNSLSQLDPEKMKSRGILPYPELTTLLTLCAHFVEPRGLPGEDTQVKHFVEKMLEMLKTRDLPEFIREVWERVQTRKGREKRWVKLDREYPIDSEWEEYPEHDVGYFTYVIHDDKLHPEFFAAVHGIYQQLGFIDLPFDPAHIDVVDLGRHLSPEMFPRLGYEEGDGVPGYRYRLKTKNDYVDSDEARIDVDLIMPLLPSSFVPAKDTPVFFLTPRPVYAYVIDFAYAHQLNARMARRLFKKETGHDFLRHLFVHGKATDFDKAIPFYKVKYQPFVSGRKALDTTNPKCEFPPWQGKPVDPLFS